MMAKESAEDARFRSAKPKEEVPGFDVLCVVGRVEFDTGDMPPHVAAMILIAEHGAEGVYSFPMSNGQTQRVTVEFEGEDSSRTTASRAFKS